MEIQNSVFLTTTPLFSTVNYLADNFSENIDEAK